MTKRERNKLIEKALQLVFEALSFMEEALYEENESLEQWPESLQETDRYYDIVNEKGEPEFVPAVFCNELW